MLIENLRYRFFSLLSYRFDSLRFFREANQSDKKRSKEAKKQSEERSE
jgi:hypothetical protein